MNLDTQPPVSQPLPSLPVLSLADDPAPFAQAIGASFRQFGFAMVKDHGLDADLIARAWQLTQGFFALPEAEKRRWAIPGIGGARGYTPFRTEIAKGALVSDLKEFWHIGRDLPEGHPLAGSMPPNVWPETPEGFRETFETLFAAFDDVGATILSRSRSGWGLRPTGSCPPSPMAIRCCACSTTRPCPERPMARSARAPTRTSTSSPCCSGPRKRASNCAPAKANGSKSRPRRARW
jgi:hypothetical protein